MAKFILADENMEANSDAANPLNFAGKHLGKCLFTAGENQINFDINPTTKAGGTMGILNGAFFEAMKDGWSVMKGEESFYCPVSFVSYYHYTQEQKEKLDRKIREGLDRIRKDIDEFNAMEDKTSKYSAQVNQLDNLKSSNPSVKKEAMYYFKHIFISEIDYYSGSIQKEEGKSSLSYLQKNSFPTIIDDFLNLDNASKIEADTYFKNMPTVEKNLLKSKLNAFNEWMAIYESTLKSRLEQYDQVRKSKEFIIKQTRESLKPYITQYKLYKESMSSTAERKKQFSNFMRHVGASEPFAAHMVHYVFKTLDDPYPIMAPKQFTREDEMNGVYGKYGCYDKFMKEELVFNSDYGLICDFPWLTEEWVEEKVKEITSAKYWNKDRIYTTFFKVVTKKTITEMPMGQGNAIMEDADFITSMFVMSRNIFAAKMLELLAKEEELEQYIDKTLGLVPAVPGRKIIFYEAKGFFDYFVEGKKYESKAKMLEAYPEDKYNLIKRKETNALVEGIKDILFINFNITGATGPYEHQFFKAVNKIFLKGPAASKFNGLCGMIMSRMNIEGPITPLQPEGEKTYQTQIDGL